MRRADARFVVLGLFSVLLVVLAGPGCARKAQVLPPEPVDVVIVEEEVVPEAVWEETVDVKDVPGVETVAARLRNVHFDFDRYNLKPETRQVLRENYALLRKLPDVKVLVEGHCDNRGTVEYNLALGQRRADSVRDYLVSLGMRPAGIRTISYGKERPVDPRNSEEAWALNRRAEFKILGR